jgi:hypothetical protein
MELRMRGILICGLPVATIFFKHYLVNGTISEKKSLTEHKMYVPIYVQILCETFLFLNEVDEKFILVFM